MSTPVLVVLTAISLSPPAVASMDFPEAIEGELSLDYDLDCDLCHEDAPGPGTATTLFAQSMIGRGLVGSDLESLVTALHALSGEGTDSDGDGVADIDELIFLLTDGLEPIDGNLAN